MDSPECVILLHGLARSARSMAKIATALRAGGYCVVNLSYPSTKLSMSEIVSDYLKPELDTLRATTHSTIHFVTHSMGGILVRLLLQTETLPQESRIVMLSPPNKGSEIVDHYQHSWWFKRINGPAGLQLGTSLTSLPNQLKPIDSAVGIITGNQSLEPWFSNLFHTENDGKVSVNSARLPEMTDFLVVAHSHTFIMRNTYVIDQIKQFLSNARFDLH